VSDRGAFEATLADEGGLDRSANVRWRVAGERVLRALASIASPWRDH
jgi:hypothetical protein